MKERPFEDEFRFLRGLVASPRGVGAIAPSSPALGRAVAAQIDRSDNGPVLELGPGTGSITREILAHGIVPERLTLIEYDADFVRLLEDRFEGVRVLQGDAFAFEDALGNEFNQPFTAIVSGIPLLNHPLSKRRQLIDSALRRLKPGGPLIQFSYGFQPPLPAPAGTSVKLGAFVWKNLPPARVWVYRRR